MRLFVQLIRNKCFSASRRPYQRRNDMSILILIDFIFIILYRLLLLTLRTMVGREFTSELILAKNISDCPNCALFR